MNKRRGFTYTEVLMALAVFCIILLPVFPALSQAAKNDRFARMRYQSQLYANEMVWAVKDALAGGISPELAVEVTILMDTDLTAGVWIWNNDGVYASPDAPPGDMAAEMDWRHAYENVGLIVAVVFDAEGYPLGRAVGMMY